MTKRKPYPYWIKERYNPQLGTYYIAMGQMSKTTAKLYETTTLYGSNDMIRFDTLKEYEAFLADLKKQGRRVN